MNRRCWHSGNTSRESLGVTVREAGKVATLAEVQAVLPVNAALVAWVDYDPSDR